MLASAFSLARTSSQLAFFLARRRRSRRRAGASCGVPMAGPLSKSHRHCPVLLSLLVHSASIQVHSDGMACCAVGRPVITGLAKSPLNGTERRDCGSCVPILLGGAPQPYPRRWGDWSRTARPLGGVNAQGARITSWHECDYPHRSAQPETTSRGVVRG